MLQEITYFMIFDKPLIVYLGSLALLVLLVAAALPVLNKKGIRTIPVRWHQACAGSGILLALAHGVLALLAYL